MRKLFIILIGLIALVNFIRAFDNSGAVNIEIMAEKAEVNSEVFSDE